MIPWSFIATVLFFTIIVVAAVVAHHRQRRHEEHAYRESERAILEAGEVAQRRHVDKFGREDTGLHKTLSIPTRRTPPHPLPPHANSPHGRHQKV